MKSAWSVTLFLLKTWKSMTLQAFLLILDGNHWKRLGCHAFLSHNMETCDASRVLTDFRLKSLEALGVSHFSCKKTWTSMTLQACLRILGKQSLIFYNPLCFFVFFAGFERKCGSVAPKWCSREWFLELIRGIRGIRGIPGSGVSFHARPLVRMTGV